MTNETFKTIPEVSRYLLSLKYKKAPIPFTGKEFYVNEKGRQIVLNKEERYVKFLNKQGDEVACFHEVTKSYVDSFTKEGEKDKTILNF